MITITALGYLSRLVLADDHQPSSPGAPEASCKHAVRRFTTDDACHETSRGRFRAYLSVAVTKEYGSAAQCTVEDAMSAVEPVLFGLFFLPRICRHRCVDLNKEFGSGV
jgi:hypothetical protein